MPTLRWRNGTQAPVPGDAVLNEGHDLPYKSRSLAFQAPEDCCLRGTTFLDSRALVAPAKWPRGIFYNLTPAPDILYLERGMGGPPDSPRSVYRGLAPSNLFPIVEQRKPWEE